MTSMIYVFIGAGLGGVCRFLISSSVPSQIDEGKFPIAILVCNIVGCFLIGTVYHFTSQQAPSWVQPLLITGFLGGFTTFSSFGLETIKMAQNGSYLQVIFYLLASIIGGIAAVVIALKIFK